MRIRSLLAPATVLLSFPDSSQTDHLINETLLKRTSHFT
jgi:hypothetical protein